MKEKKEQKQKVKKFDKKQLVKDFINSLGTKKVFDYLHLKKGAKFSNEFLLKLGNLEINKDAILVDTEKGITIDNNEKAYKVTFIDKKINPRWILES